MRVHAGAWVSDSPRQFYQKKSLPWLLISGIPRPRAGTTNLLSTGNGIGFSGFQRWRTRAGTGAAHVRWRKSRRENHKRCGPGDHCKDSPGDYQKDQTSREKNGTHER
jgi:hypothetical protein